MTFEAFQTMIYELNKDELFYKKYYFARQQKYSLQQFLATLDMDYVRANNLLIPELPETIPPRYEDAWIFNSIQKQNISVFKHNCYSPAILHSHTFFEIIYVYDGTCRQNINGTDVSMRSGDVCIIPPGVTHSISVFDESVVLDVLIKKSTLENIFFNFLRSDNILSMFFLNSIYSSHVNDYIIFHSGTDNHIRTAMTFLALEDINQETYSNELKTNTTMNIFALLLRYYEKNVEVPSIASKADIQRFALLRFIQDNFTDVTLEAVAEKFHYTPEYTSKLIRTATGMTFTAILQRIRIERAEALLADTNMSVSSIALQVGYMNTEHFIRTFKKVNHMTPTAFRKQGIRR